VKNTVVKGLNRKPSDVKKGMEEMVMKGVEKAKLSEIM
jgi:hypothetical protein